MIPYRSNTIYHLIDDLAKITQSPYKCKNRYFLRRSRVSFDWFRLFRKTRKWKLESCAPGIISGNFLPLNQQRWPGRVLGASSGSLCLTFQLLAEKNLGFRISFGENERESLAFEGRDTLRDNRVVGKLGWA